MQAMIDDENGKIIVTPLSKTVEGPDATIRDPPCPGLSLSPTATR